MNVQSTHFQAKVLKRSAGKNALASSAYRAGQKLTDELTGQIFDFTRKQKVEATKIMAPSDAPEWITDRNRLWNEVERHETRKDAQLAREIEISLPVGLSEEGREKLVFDFAKEHFVTAGMVADICIHGPGKGDDRNHHAHILLTTRSVRKRGFGPKNRDWNQKPLLDGWKMAWEAACNTALKNEGSKVRVDRRSIKQRRQAALDAAKKTTDRIESKRHMIEAARLDYTARPHLPQTPYRMMIEGKPIPDRWAEKVQEWKEATKSRERAHERAKEMQDSLEREIDAQNVPMDPHKAYSDLLEPLLHRDVLDTTIATTAMAIFVHDPIYDIAPILADHAPAIQDVTDLRQVQAELASSLSKRGKVGDEIMMSDELDPPYCSLERALRRLPEINKAKPWANAERILRNHTNERIAKTIITAVERLATLIQSEKIAKNVAKLNRPVPPPTEIKRPEAEPAAAPRPNPSGGLSM